MKVLNPDKVSVMFDFFLFKKIQLLKFSFLPVFDIFAFFPKNIRIWNFLIFDTDFGQMLILFGEKHINLEFFNPAIRSLVYVDFSCSEKNAIIYRVRQFFSTFELAGSFFLDIIF
jgi:hypothetical protein